jgi:hypothetical protein
MSDFANEAAAEDFLIGAVTGTETPLANTEINQAEDLDRQDDDEQRDDEQRAEGEQEKQPETKAKATEQATPEEDEVEVPGAEGEEPKRYKLADLVTKAQEYERLESQKAQIVENVERQAVEAATGQLRQIEQAGKQTAYMIQGALQLLQAPQPPSTEMLNPASQQYNPDQYHMQFAHYQRATQQFQQAQGVANQLMQQAQAAQTQAQEVRETRELQRLQRAWPEFGQPETTNKFVEDMSKAYGFTAQELDDVLVDHRQALVARDALAFRAMKAQSGDVKAKVEAKAPKLVRTKQEAKGSAAQARDPSGQFASNAMAELKRTNSDEAATRLFAGLVKAGRI